MKRQKTFYFGVKQFMLVCLWGILLVSGLHLQGATFTVNTTDDTVDANPGDGAAADSSGKCSLRAAIMEANALSGADIITVPAGDYKLTISGADEDNCASGDLDILSNLTINGAGKHQTIIDGNELDRIFHIEGNWTVTISNLTVRKGKTPDGETIDDSSSLQDREFPRQPRERMKLNKNFDPHLRGSGIPPFSKVWPSAGLPETREENDSMTAVVRAGDGGDGGGILNHNATLTIERCRILANITGNGGGYLKYKAGGDSGHGGCGGGLCNLAGTVVINHSVISDNTTGDGGTDCYNMTGGDGGHGGGLFNMDGFLTLNNCTIKDNLCGDHGFSCAELGPRGYAGSGGGISNRHTYGNTSTLILTNCTIMDNSTGDGMIPEGNAGNGGGIENITTANIYNCLIYRNSCGEGTTGGCGGGIANYGTLYMTNSTISANSYGDTFYVFGGGLYNYKKEAFALLESCTVTGNNDDGLCNGEPGAWYWDHATSVLKTHNTIVANHLIYNYATSSYVPNDCLGKITSLGYNLIESGCSAFSYDYYCDIIGDTASNIIGVDPNLGALVDNGGPTKTHALLGGSPCLDTGDPENYETTDQRGVLRPKDGSGDGAALPDIGAYEEFTPQITITTPSAGAKICGCVLLEAEANTLYVDFYIDGDFLQTADGSPHTCSWDSTNHSNGAHVIKAVCYDSSGGFSANDTINVKVDNTIIKLGVSRHEESAWLIAKEYGKVTFTVQHTGITAPAGFQIERKEADGTTFSIIKEVTAAETGGAAYTYYDPLANTATNYTYRVTAVDGSGENIGRSGETTI